MEGSQSFSQFSDNLSVVPPITQLEGTCTEKETATLPAVPNARILLLGMGSGSPHSHSIVIAPNRKINLYHEIPVKFQWVTLF